MGHSPLIAHLAVWLLALLPGLLALPYVGGGLDNAQGGLNALGRLAGIWGLALLLMAAALCCRVPGFDRPFGGLTKLWQLHHRLGASAFLLLLAHPLLLAFSATGTSLDAAVGTLLSTQPASVWGWVALLALMAFMAPSFGFFGEPDYQRWKWLHRLSGVTVILALLHTGLLSRTLPGWLAWGLWTTLALLAIAALGYRWLYARWRGRSPYRVTGIGHPARDVVELTLAPEQQHMGYRAGQFIYLTPEWGGHVGHDEEHPYTLSSAPDEPDLRVAIKDLGDASHAMLSIPEGTQLWVEGPYGDFFSTVSARPELWIAGGIGITPFLGRVREAVRAGRSLRVHLIDCVQDETRFLFADELKAAFEGWPDSQLSVHYFYREGPLNQAFIQQVCPDVADRAVFVCGPLPLLERAREALSACGVPAGRLVTEEFVLL
ncbi:ferric reductase-like transmembrane domain-containing protein [Marinimicrobium sp. LS-A18]|uniref:ferredoxin reductase family protein n=1 Tax=Marinimicrobium sp. LS-A18 TaxID=1381596 RepID=UPI000466E811|nr:ferric reductase-like transmembrane domain-containing protein [Marinimicrobium sp. LS-A18]